VADVVGAAAGRAARVAVVRPQRAQFGARAVPAPPGTTPPAAGSDARRARRYATATMREPSPVRVDGRLDDAAWRAPPVASAFRTVEPTEGARARFPTEVRVLYDDEALYVGASCAIPPARAACACRTCGASSTTTRTTCSASRSTRCTTGARSPRSR
jgi:hypothetical protein